MSQTMGCCFVPLPSSSFSYRVTATVATWTIIYRVFLTYRFLSISRWCVTPTSPALQVTLYSCFNSTWSFPALDPHLQDMLRSGHPSVTHLAVYKLTDFCTSEAMKLFLCVKFLQRFMRSNPLCRIRGGKLRGVLPARLSFTLHGEPALPLLQLNNR